MKRVIIIISILFLGISNISLKSSLAAQDIPKIKVVWRSGIIVSVLVAPNSTSEQLKSLIYTFKKARKEFSLTKYIPATTPGIKGDPHAQVIVFVFSDPKWATENEYKKYERASMTTQAGKSTAKTYLNHIRASYEWNSLDTKEFGAFGYDEGGMRSASYKKLF